MFKFLLSITLYSYFLLITRHNPTPLISSTLASKVLKAVKSCIDLLKLIYSSFKYTLIKCRFDRQECEGNFGSPRFMRTYNSSLSLL